MKRKSSLINILLLCSFFAAGCSKTNGTTDILTTPVAETTVTPATDAPTTAVTPDTTPKDEAVTYYNITFYDGTEIIGTQAIKKGELAVSFTPKKDDYKFDGWFKDAGFMEAFDFTTAITANTALYAKFSRTTPEQFPVALSADGKTVTYGYAGSEKTIAIGEKSIYVDGRLSDEQIEGFSNVYNSFKQALEHLVDGTESEPMNVYVAPYVYWMHNPDSTSTDTDTGTRLTCQNLHITGLTDDARNVVIASNYGHNEGYDGGNWTMFNISGDGLNLTNITFGDYCNVDLDYPLDPSLSRKKRTTNVTQGQIGFYNGDRLYCNNVRFISRLNMMPFISNKRALYVNCHMESTDDSLNGSSQAVYLNCDFEFYASKPWGGSSGVTLLNSNIKIVHLNQDGDVIHQYLSKGEGPFTVVDCRFTGDYTIPVNIGYSDILSSTFRSYYSNVTYNGTQIKLDDGGAKPETAVDITGTDALKAYKLTQSDGSVIYNVYNLLRGTDEWDPLEQKDAITALNAGDVATKLVAYTAKTQGYGGYVYTRTATLETGKENANQATINYDVAGPQSTDYKSGVTVKYELVNPNDSAYVSLATNDDGSCTVTATNEEEDTHTIIINVKSNIGLVSAVSLTVKPSILEAPSFLTQPTVKQNTDGTASVDYSLDLGTRADMSRITWYACDDETGTNPIEIATGRDSSNPLKKIALSNAYVGKHILVKVEPKHIRSDYGTAVSAVSTAITETGITASKAMNVDLASFPTSQQSALMDGFWTRDAYMPNDCKPNYVPLDATEVSTKYSSKVKGTFGGTDNNWAYGTGNKNGFLNYTGIYSTKRGARLRYTPKDMIATDMDVTLKIAPGKTAGQGFGSDYQYIDTMIKFDNETLTGYGLRVYRSSGDSCDFVLMQYANGLSKELTEPVTSSAYLTEVTLRVWTDNNTLNATVNSSKAQPATAVEKGYLESVSLSTPITASTNQGFCFISTSTVGDNTSYIGDISLNWN